jgi:methyltransferase (TIGR00027 family)
MAKTGSDAGLGTAEGAVTSRAAHALHAEAPILDDRWAAELLLPEAQQAVRDPAHYREHHDPRTSAMAPVAAIGIGCLRLAEDTVTDCAEEGIAQYAILGAGFDTFALRRSDLAGRLQVFEIDYPDVQKLKRERVAAAATVPASSPEYVPIDFETMQVSEALASSSFDPERRAVFSWMNTIPYLSRDAIRATLEDLHSLAATGSVLVLNYNAAVPLTDEQQACLKNLIATVAALGEPLSTERWAPEDFESLLSETGFDIVEHLTEADLIARYFASRDDGFSPGLPLRVIIAEPRAGG